MQVTIEQLFFFLLLIPNLHFIERFGQPQISVVVMLHVTGSSVSETESSCRKQLWLKTERTGKSKTNRPLGWTLCRCAFGCIKWPNNAILAPREKVCKVPLVNERIIAVKSTSNKVATNFRNFRSVFFVTFGHFSVSCSWFPKDIMKAES